MVEAWPGSFKLLAMASGEDRDLTEVCRLIEGRESKRRELVRARSSKALAMVAY